MLPLSHFMSSSFSDIALSLSGTNSLNDKEIEANNNKKLSNFIFLFMFK